MVAIKLRWPETGCVGQKLAGKVRGCITSGILGAPTHSGVSHKVQESEIRNQESVAGGQKIRGNQEAGLPHNQESQRVFNNCKDGHR